MSKTLPFRCFSTCIAVKGAERSVICDIQRKKYHFIPNDLYEILHNFQGKTLSFIKKHYENQYDEVIQEYFDFLEENEYIFYTEIPELFPPLDLRWEMPCHITNAIIDIDETKAHLDWQNIVAQLETLHCQSIQVRAFSDIDLTYLESVVEALEESCIISVEFLIKYENAIKEEDLLGLCDKYPRIFAFYQYNAPETKSVHFNNESMGHLFQVKEDMKNHTHCGQISQSQFILNVHSFTESQHHNTCLNRKISIDVEGNIKNCPSMVQSFGNIKDTTLAEAMQHPDFKKYWNITKDQISVCKDCEFRHICTDCRAYIENTEDIYSKPLKCGYNPYTCEWEEWSTNPLKQKAIDHYGMRELVLEK